MSDDEKTSYQMCAKLSGGTVCSQCVLMHVQVNTSVFPRHCCSNAVHRSAPRGARTVLGEL